MTALRTSTMLTTLTLLAAGACGPNQSAIGPVSPTDPEPGLQTDATAADHDTAANSAELTTVLTSSTEKLETFKSTRDLGKYLTKLAKEQERRYRASAGAVGTTAAEPSAAPSSDMTVQAAPEAESSPAMADEDDAAGGDGESITNNQEAGVDEGGIVKSHGDHLVVLRRGRLFTVDVGDRDMRPVSMVDVSPTDGHDAWYDEMLIHDDTIVVVGFSYQVGATELGLFEIDRRGNLSRKDTFFLRSNDYYSSRNYASRLVGDQLVFYMPYYLGLGFNADNPNLPGVTHWNDQRGRVDDWDLVISGEKIYKPIQKTDNPVLHTVVTCDLSRGRMDCDAQGIVGPAGRNFYVSKSAVYVWVHEGYWGQPEHGEGGAPAVVYRLPMTGKRRRQSMGALRVWGAPVDQFSFKESSDGHLNVLVRADSTGDAMWAPEFSQGDIAMLRVPVEAFDRGVSTVAADAFADLPEPKSNDYYAFQNRFVGDYLLYGMGSGWGGAAQSADGEVFAFPFRSDRDAADTIAVPHGVDRIEAMGDNAVIVGSDGRNLHFTALELGARPGVAGAYVQRNASQGELRSHGFFYKPTGRDQGMLGLPVRHASEPGYAHLIHGSAEVMFLGVEDLNFHKLGGLGSDRNAGTDDQCKVSCVDWYGNARPIFYKGRVFALLGYELVEGAVRGRRIKEVNRANMLDLVHGRRDRTPLWKAK
jgi:hypothetical protein